MAKKPTGTEPIEIRLPGSEVSEQPAGGDVASGDSKPEGGDSKFEGAPSRIAGFEAVSPIDIDASGGGAKRRGRPPGGKNRPTETKKTSDLTADLESLILSFNLGIAALLDAPEFEEIDAEKNKAVANGIRGLAALYSKTLNPKTVAWANFGMALASAYGPPIYFTMKRAPVRPPAPAGLAVVPPKAALKPNGRPPGPDLGAAMRNAEQLVNQAAKEQMSPSQLWDEPGGGPG